MSNLTLYQNPFPDAALSKLDRSESKIVRASFPSETNLRISQMSPEQTGKLVTAIAAKVAVRLGTEKDEREQILINREINADLMKFPALTENEILRALVNGLDGQYLREGSFVYFTPSNFVQWIKAYIEQEKKPVMKKIAQLAQQITEPVAPQTEKQKLQTLHRHFLYALQKGEEYQDWGSMVYSFLEQTDLPSISKEEKWKAIDLAKLTILQEAGETNNIHTIRASLEMMRKAENGTVDNKIIIAAKQIVVSNIIRQYMSMNDEEKKNYLDVIFERVNYLIENLSEP